MTKNDTINTFKDKREKKICFICEKNCHLGGLVNLGMPYNPISDNYKNIKKVIKICDGCLKKLSHVEINRIWRDKK